MTTIRRFVNTCEFISTIMLITLCVYAYYIALTAINGQWGMLTGSIPMTDQFCEGVIYALTRGSMIQLIGWLVYITFHLLRKVIEKKEEERV